MTEAKSAAARMRRAMLDHNGTVPELESRRDGGFVRVTYRLVPPAAE